MQTLTITQQNTIINIKENEQRLPHNKINKINDRLSRITFRYYI